MKTIEQLRQQIQNYREMLAVMKRSHRTPQDEVTERLLSRLLFETTAKLKAMEQNAVKVYCDFDANSKGAPYPIKRGRKGATGRAN